MTSSARALRRRLRRPTLGVSRFSSVLVKHWGSSQLASLLDEADAETSLGTTKVSARALHINRMLRDLNRPRTTIKRGLTSSAPHSSHLSLSSFDPMI